MVQWRTLSFEVFLPLFVSALKLSGAKCTVVKSVYISLCRKKSANHQKSPGSHLHCHVTVLQCMTTVIFCSPLWEFNNQCLDQNANYTQILSMCVPLCTYVLCKHWRLYSTSWSEVSRKHSTSCMCTRIKRGTGTKQWLGTIVDFETRIFLVCFSVCWYNLSNLLLKVMHYFSVIRILLLNYVTNCLNHKTHLVNF